jgi:hypothetical protein
MFEQYIGNGIVGIILLVLGFMLNSNINSRFTRIETDMKSGFDGLRNELASMRDMLTGKIIEHTERITRVEDNKQDKKP